MQPGPTRAASKRGAPTKCGIQKGAPTKRGACRRWATGDYCDRSARRLKPGEARPTCSKLQSPAVAMPEPRRHSGQSPPAAPAPASSYLLRRDMGSPHGRNGRLLGLAILGIRPKREVRSG